MQIRKTSSLVLLVLISGLVGAVVYATFAPEPSVAHIVEGEELPNMIQADVQALVAAYTIQTGHGSWTRGCGNGIEAHYIGSDTWMVRIGQWCAVTVSDRTGQVTGPVPGP